MLDTPTRLWSPDLNTGIMSKKRFRELSLETRSTFFGKTYVKIAPSMAEDESRHGHIFMDEVEVEPIESDAPMGKLEAT